VDYTTAVNNINPKTCAADTAPANNTLPTNRGDGTPDNFVRCTTAAPCSVAQLANAVEVKIYVLARSSQATPGYVDNKTYCLGTFVNGACPPAAQVTGPGDGLRRHVYSTSVRLVNVSGRRESPQ
jgi:type IV pilus assembly protein PilW